MKTQLLSMTPEELGVYLKELGQPAFRAKQLFAWLHQGVPFERMSNLPKSLRETLAENCLDNPVQVLETITSKLDGTIKLLYRLPDDHVIEGVLMRYKYGNTLCLSTQVGCRMGCKFCASTPLAQTSWPRISPALRLRAQPSSVEAQNAQPIRQPTCVETQSVLPYL